MASIRPSMVQPRGARGVAIHMRMKKDRQDKIAPLNAAARDRRWIRAAAAAVVLAGGLAIWSWSDEALPSDLGLCLSEAERANASHDLERERRVLEHAERLAGEGQAGEAAERLAGEVQRRLAALDWKYHHEYTAARDRLLRAAKGAEPADTWLAMARLEQARESFDDAREAARQALAQAETDRERRLARVALAKASVAEAVARRRAGEVADSEALRAAFADLHDLVLRDSGVLEPSRLLLRAALLLDRGDAAMLAWRSYFHAAPGTPVANLVAGAGVELEGLLSAWTGDATPTGERIALVEALETSRFFTEAALVALDPRAARDLHEHPAARGAITYAGAIGRVREIVDEFYRQTILGAGDWSDTQHRIQAELRAAIREIEGDEAASMAWWEMTGYLNERFGANISLGETAGYLDLHMGHRVIDETRVVEQYDRRAQLRFVALDNMVSNGFESWAWEGGGQHGGWAGSDVIYQVRPVYAGHAVEIWRQLHTVDELEEIEAEMTRESSLDDARARENPHAFLPGLAMRLKHQGVYGLLDRVRSEAAEGENLRLRFLSEAERVVQESSIFAHEGRHAIDKRAGSRMSGVRVVAGDLIPWIASEKEGLEFTAKLSEVAFAPEPRLALFGILTANIGDHTPHGRANLKIVKSLVSWMETHRDAIAGLDSERPLLPQLDLLSDQQLRDAFRSMDPLAAG